MASSLFAPAQSLYRCGVAALLCLPVMVMAQSASQTEIQQLLRQGQNQQALSAAEAAIAANPRDPQLRFLQANAQTALGQTADAEQTLESLRQQYPELPEPYNNLAVIKAGKGDLAEARSLLEQAIRNKPDYVQAHENLADVLVKLAAEHLEKAQQLAPSLNRSQKIESLQAWPNTVPKP